MSSITVIIPAYNEEERIAATLRAIIDRKRHEQLIVIDDGSEDQTARVASDFGVQLVRLPLNQGKAAAIEAGIKLATGDIIVLLDADLGKSARYYPRLVEPLLTGKAEMAVALLESRPGTGGFGLVKRLAFWGLYWLTGEKFPPVLSGQRAVLKGKLAQLMPLGTGFGLELAMTVRAIRAGLSLAQVRLPMEHAYTKKNWVGFRHRAHQFRDILRTIVKLKQEQAK